ncbi:hypothetical protein [Chitinophaga sp. CF418]|uniref:hypothetical protein n=1 Tax=Chitinophaga sp. CF418 TaxID=1855287 RepID=UPI00091B1CEB|nr:hypothetical protein [Chitinophaga sp. CF418]SHN10706.1 hypothetical protein SAMN05216311_105192 [Chitinophaga sp. CF418]
MAEQKTKPTQQTVASFLEGVPDENVRKDCFDLVQLMEKATGFPPTMWGASIVGKKMFIALIFVNNLYCFHLLA